MSHMLWHALVAFIVLPGTVAFIVPLFVIAPSTPFRAEGLLPLALGTVTLLWCVRDFYAAGKGTLAPWSPPKELVVSGPYLVSRNPMYIAVSLILWGWALGYRSWALGIYALAVLVAFHLRIVLHEEPWLSRTFGEHWVRYRSQAPRWLGWPRWLRRW